MIYGGLLFLVLIPLVGAALWVFPLPRPFFVHAVFVLAALPLIWSAMLHFVPVLTRSGSPPPILRGLPALAIGVAIPLLAVFAGGAPRHALLLVAVLVGAGALGLQAWAYRRARRVIGTPHPGVRWYLASLGLLVLAMVAVAGMVFDTARYAVWYGLHLHLNLLGWFGLTVLGTLPVLLPTCLHKFEPNATFRLRLGLPWAIFGVLAVAFGAALRLPVLAAFGAISLIGLIATHWRAWFRFFGAPWRWAGPGQSLLLGSAFLLLLMPVGIAHGFGLVGGGALLPAFVAGFLLPTVLGALAQLLPVWKFPGPDSPARQALAATLSVGAGWRGALCFLVGLGQLLSFGPSLIFAGIAVLWLLVSLLWGIRPQMLRPRAPL